METAEIDGIPRIGRIERRDFAVGFKRAQRIHAISDLADAPPFRRLFIRRGLCILSEKIEATLDIAVSNQAQGLHLFVAAFEGRLPKGIFCCRLSFRIHRILRFCESGFERGEGTFHKLCLIASQFGLLLRSQLIPVSIEPIDPSFQFRILRRPFILDTHRESISVASDPGHVADKEPTLVTQRVIGSKKADNRNDCCRPIGHSTLHEETPRLNRRNNFAAKLGGMQ